MRWQTAERLHRPASEVEGSEVGQRRRKPVLRAPIQYKLAVGATHDPAETEADALAARALKQIDATDVSSADHAAGRHEIATSVGRIRRSGSLATSVGAEGGAVADSTAQQIESERGGGRALDPALRGAMETGFGADFSSVRMHTDSTADQLSTDLQAKAFTTGSDIFFRAGQYDPSSQSGRQLVAHELAHTVQQGGGVQRQHDPSVIRRAFELQKTSWKDAISISASGGASLTGVFFLKNKGGKSLVVKPAAGGARNQLAGEMMAASGAHSVDQRTIPLDSPEGKAVLKVMKTLAAKKAKSEKLAKGTHPIEAKITNQLEGGQFDSLSVMEGYDNLSNMEDLHKSDKFPEVFQSMVKNGFFNGLGRTHAADMMMGNEDRLERMNDKNIFVNLWSGQSVGLDLDLNAASFEQVTGDKTEGKKASQNKGQSAPSLAGHQYKDFVSFSIDGTADAKRKVNGPKGEVDAGMGMRGGGMATSAFTKAADPGKAAQVFEDFRQRMIDRAASEKFGNEKMLATFDWSSPKAQFLKGVADGMAALVAKMDAINDRAGALKSEHGEDNFLDPRVFKIRAMYYKLLSKGYSDKMARETLEMYAEHLVNGGTDDNFMHWVDQYFASFAPSTTGRKKPDMPALPATPTKPLLRARPPKRRIKV